MRIPVTFGSRQMQNALKDQMCNALVPEGSTALTNLSPSIAVMFEFATNRKQFERPLILADCRRRCTVTDPDPSADHSIAVRSMVCTNCRQ